MITRNLIKFGKNSYVISLPKHWIDNNKLLKGSELHIEEKSNNLTVYCDYTEPDDQRVKVINTDHPTCSVSRELISAYINDYQDIKVIGKKTNDSIKEIRYITGRLVALEIMEQVDGKVTLKDFLNIKDISMDNIIHRIDIIVRSIFIDLLGNMFEGKKFDLMERDIDVNRLYFLASKILNKLLNNPGLSKVIKVEINDIIHIWRFVEALENIADILKSMQSINLDPKSEMIKDLREVFISVQEQYLKAIKGFYKKDRLTANEIINTQEALKDSINILRDEKTITKDVKTGSNLLKITERLRNVIVHITTIAYTTINTDKE